MAMETPAPCQTQRAYLSAMGGIIGPAAPGGLGHAWEENPVPDQENIKPAPLHARVSRIEQWRRPRARNWSCRTARGSRFMRKAVSATE